MNRKRWWHSLQWKLTLTYTLVTVLASMALIFALFAGVGYLIFRSDELPLALAEAVAVKSEEGRGAVLTGDPVEVNRWLGDLARRGAWNIINNSGFQYSVGLGADDSAVLVVYDAQGQFLGATRALTATAFLPDEPRLLAAALAGERNPEALSVRQADRMLAVAPVFDTAGRAAGALVARVALGPADERTFWLVAAVGSVLPSLCFIAPLAAVVGLTFGFFTARGLARRLTRVAQASEAWRRGDFSQFVQDASGDELGTLAQRLNDMARQLQALLTAQQALAVAEERNRLALDLHDSVKQQAFAASAQLAAARALLASQPAAAEARLAEAEALLDGLRQELAHLILELRPPALAEKGLATALREYTQDWARQNNLALTVVIQVSQRLALEVEQALYRIAQEALANAARHSQARRVEVALTETAEALTLAIYDDGRGFDPANVRAGVGLRSMQERAAALGATLTIDAAPPQGTRVTVRWPRITPPRSA